MLIQLFWILRHQKPSIEKKQIMVCFLYKNVRLAYSYNGKKIASFLAVAISEWGLNKMPKKSCPFLYSESIYKYGQDLWDT